MKNTVKLSMAAFAALAFGSSAQAANTTAGTAISNQASVSYTLGSETKSIDSNIDSFNVDAKVDLFVTAKDDFDQVATKPGEQIVFTFDVENIGNIASDYALSFQKIGSGADLGDLKIYVESGGAVGFDTDDVEISTLDNVATSSDTRVVYLVGTVPNNAQGESLGYALIATAWEADGSKVFDESDTVTAAGEEVDVVFADAEGVSSIEGIEDGVHAAYAGQHAVSHVIGEIVLTIGKSSVVLSDPINDAVNPKAIPGAVVEYTISITNAATASATAEDVVVTDTLNTTLVALNSGVDAYGANQDIKVVKSVSGVAAAPVYYLKSATTDVSGSPVTVYNAGAITIGELSLAKDEVIDVSFKVTIQ